MNYSAKKPWRDRCSELHDFVAEIHVALTAEGFRQEISELLRRIETRNKQWSDYEKDWEQRRLKHFEEVVAKKRPMRDRDQDLRGTHCWDSLLLPLTAADAKDVLKSPLYLFCKNHCRIPPRPGRKPYVREIYLEGWVPHELSNKDFNKRFRLLSPVENTEDLTRSPDRLEILATLVFVHDADGDFPPLISENDPLVQAMTANWFVIQRIFGDGDNKWAKSLKSWLDSLDPEPGKTKADDPPDGKVGKWGVASLDDIPERSRSFSHSPAYIVQNGYAINRQNPPAYLRSEMKAGRLTAYWPKGAKKVVVDVTTFPSAKHKALFDGPVESPPGER